MRTPVIGYKPVIGSLPPTTSTRIAAAVGTAAPQTARTYVRGAVRGLDLSDERLGDLDLLVSELVTNAVVHAQTDIEVAVHCDPESVGVEVRDFGPGLPEPRVPVHATVGGWGLQLLRRISSGWGVAVADPGKVVWFRLPLY